MAVATQHSTKATSRHLPHSHLDPAQPRASRQRFVTDFSQCLFEFVIQLLPTVEELAVKEDVRKLLERLIRTIEPDSRLLSFGSTANGFSLRNSDMDLCCLIDSEERLAATDLVNMLGDLLERVKVWCKRRKINSPYKGTLSSYGYVLLVIYFLVHVKNPPVLPNLQQMPPMRPISHVRTISSWLPWVFAYVHLQEDTHIGGHNTWFFDDVELLRQRWQSANTDSVGQLLIDFFKYFSRDFLYNTGVASIRAGLIKKDSKGWQNDLDPARYKDTRERNRFCIETCLTGSFETDFNVARCVTRDGLYTIRGEFMRASRILSTRPERAIYAIAQLCEERMEALIPATSPTAAFVPPRLSPFPPQTPYTVGSSPMRQTRIEVPEPKNVSEAPSKPPSLEVPPAPGPSTSTPEHMAPKRSKWTSPPPPNASAEDLCQFEGQLDLGLALATRPTDARQTNAGYASSSNNSEILTDDGDDLQSIRSLSLSEAPERSRDRHDGVSESLPISPAPSPQVSSYSAPRYSPQLPIPEGILVPTKVSHVPPREPYQHPAFPNTLPGFRGRAPRHLEFIQTSPRLNSPRRSHSGPPGPSSAGLNSKPFQLLTMAAMTPLPPSPSPPSPQSSQPYVYYESAPSPTMVYPVSPRYPPRFHAAAIAAASVAARARMAPSPTATPTAHSHFQVHHAHSHSMTTVHARTPSPRTGVFANRQRGGSTQSTGSASPSPPDSLSAGSDSPAPSSLSSQCDPGADLVGWEQGGEGEENETPDVSVDGGGGAKVDGWGGVQGKVPSDVLSHPLLEQSEEAAPRPMRGTPSPS
ncbi:hypothetical protein EI94DRAFT_1704748 [Lactarius quietus]|nr:hypothetical protein EI94DRAFT_1704748 [Lactarius quietus]